MEKEKHMSVRDEVRPEDVVRLILKNLREWKTLDEIEGNLRKILWNLEDPFFDALVERFNLGP